jgi:hypothetical protein
MTFSVKDPFLISYAFTHLSGADSGFMASSARPSHNKSFRGNEKRARALSSLLFLSATGSSRLMTFRLVAPSTLGDFSIAILFFTHVLSHHSSTVNSVISKINLLRMLFILHNMCLATRSDCMSKAKRKKTEYMDTDDAEQEKERENGDIYDDKQREEMLDEDEITAAENAFMQGREITPEKRKRSTHKDTVSVKLAEDEYKED